MFLAENRQFRKLSGLSFTFSVLLLSAAVFTVSHLFPDEMIEPKWYAAGAVALVAGFVLASLRLAMPSAVRFAPLWAGFMAACIAVCAAQAAYFVLQECGAAVALLCNLICLLPGEWGMIPLNAVTPVLGAPVIVYVIVRQRRIKYFN